MILVPCLKDFSHCIHINHDYLSNIFIEVIFCEVSHSYNDVVGSRVIHSRFA